MIKQIKLEIEKAPRFVLSLGFAVDKDGIGFLFGPWVIEVTW